MDYIPYMPLPLTLASYVFYLTADVRYLVFLLLTTVTTYFTALHMGKALEVQDAYLAEHKKELSREEKKQWLNELNEIDGHFFVDEDGTVYLAFRGTDDTLAGWKEDFLLACMPEVPAQKKAVEYVKNMI